MKLADVRTVVRGLSIERLAVQAGILPATLAAIESGNAQPDAETAQQIASALGVNGQLIEEFWPVLGKTTSRYWQAMTVYDLAASLSDDTATIQAILEGRSQPVSGDELRRRAGYPPRDLAA